MPLPPFLILLPPPISLPQLQHLSCCSRKFPSCRFFLFPYYCTRQFFSCHHRIRPPLTQLPPLALIPLLPLPLLPLPPLPLTWFPSLLLIVPRHAHYSCFRHSRLSRFRHYHTPLFLSCYSRFHHPLNSTTTSPSSSSTPATPASTTSQMREGVSFLRDNVDAVIHWEWRPERKMQIKYIHTMKFQTQWLKKLKWKQYL